MYVATSLETEKKLKSWANFSSFEDFNKGFFWMKNNNNAFEGAVLWPAGAKVTSVQLDAVEAPYVGSSRRVPLTRCTRKRPPSVYSQQENKKRAEREQEY